MVRPLLLLVQWGTLGCGMTAVHDFFLRYSLSHGTCKSLKSLRYVLLADFQAVHDYCGYLQCYYLYHALYDHY